MRKAFIFFLLIAAVGLAAYSNTFNVPFVFDDLNIDSGIVLNPVVKDLHNFTASLKGYDYNPRRFIGYLTFALNYRYGGLEVIGYHIVNLAIHIFNALFVYFLVILTFRTPYFTGEKLVVSSEKADNGSEKLEVRSGQTEEESHYSLFTTHYSPVVDYSHLIALFTALLFVAHPVQTQAVTYIIQRSTSLATMFYLLAVIMYIKGRLASGQARKLSNWQADKLASFVLSLLFAVLAMMTKEIAFTLPVLIVLYEFTFFRSTLKRKLLFLLPMALTLLIIPLNLINTHRSLGEILSDLGKVTRIQTDISRGDYLLTQMRVVVTYIRLLFFPVNQNIDYDYPVYHSFFSPPVFLSFMFLSALFGTAIYLLYRSGQGTRVSSKKLAVSSELTEAEEGGPGNDLPFTTHHSLLTIHYFRLIAFGILWFFITLSVESSFIPIADLIFEHRLYLPSVGAFLAIAVSIVLLPPVRKTDPRAIAAVLSIIVVLYAGMTYRRNLVWNDPVSLWKETVRKSPYKARPLYNLGIVYENRGDNENAAAFYNYAAMARPDYFEALTRLGYVYYKTGKIALAEKEYNRAISVNPDYAYAYSYMGELYAKKGEYGKAIEFFRYATYLKDDAEFYNNLGTMFLNTGYFNDAVEALKTAISVNPNYIMSYMTLGEAYQKQHDYPQAIKVYKEALEKGPDTGVIRASLCQAYYSSGDLVAARKEYMLLRKSGQQKVISSLSLEKELGLQ